MQDISGVCLKDPPSIILDNTIRLKMKERRVSHRERRSKNTRPGNFSFTPALGDYTAHIQPAKHFYMTKYTPRTSQTNYWQIVSTDLDDNLDRKVQALGWV